MRRLTLNQRLIKVGVCSRAPFLTISMVVREVTCPELWNAKTSNIRHSDLECHPSFLAIVGRKVIFIHPFKK